MADRHREPFNTHHSDQVVLNNREFELLLETCGDKPAPRGFQTRLICLLWGSARATGRCDRPPTDGMDRLKSPVNPNSPTRTLWVCLLRATGQPGSNPHRKSLGSERCCNTFSSQDRFVWPFHSFWSVSAHRTVSGTVRRPIRGVRVPEMRMRESRRLQRREEHRIAVSPQQARVREVG